ncbi:TRAF-like [Sesbania bispinosa]|nr:TRAF-like [Sesbania bispinosa]
MQQQQPPDEEMEEIAVPPFVIPEDSQPIDAQAENMSSHFLDNLPSGRFTWTINDFSSLPEKVYSSSFCVGGYKWRILLFPKGNDVDYLSMYLDVTDSETMPHGWSRPAQFSLAVVNQICSISYQGRYGASGGALEEVRPQWRGQKVDGCKSRSRMLKGVGWIMFEDRLVLGQEGWIYPPLMGLANWDGGDKGGGQRGDATMVHVAVAMEIWFYKVWPFLHQHWSLWTQAHKHDTDSMIVRVIGVFTSFMPLAELYEPEGSWVTAHVTKEGNWLCWTEKPRSYMLHEFPASDIVSHSLFRKVCTICLRLRMILPSGSIPLGHYKVYSISWQYGDSSVATKELTKSFGWDTYDAFMQHDVQELNRVLCEKLEDKMKGTVVEGTMQQLFEGHHMNYIECINVDYKSTRKESFYGMQFRILVVSNIIPHILGPYGILDI